MRVLRLAIRFAVTTAQPPMFGLVTKLFTVQARQQGRGQLHDVQTPVFSIGRRTASQVEYKASAPKPLLLAKGLHNTRIEPKRVGKRAPPAGWQGKPG